MEPQTVLPTSHAFVLGGSSVMRTLHNQTVRVYAGRLDLNGINLRRHCS